ncbi:hypothetical protein BJ508DRAFT_671 [Ascobolus immersus RN42]|uniref:Uncharacterized protein n=1 Tax=Ascobolus immersus RN42 TaxID=1160509 RepID=A0A3N4IP49_ASCIM|nr:hypothetical protein BJ508DRAFT_671 [Ascobolus immersus RN42]
MVQALQRGSYCAERLPYQLVLWMRQPITRERAWITAFCTMMPARMLATWVHQKAAKTSTRPLAKPGVSTDTLRTVPLSPHTHQTKGMRTRTFSGCQNHAQYKAVVCDTGRKSRLSPMYAIIWVHLTHLVVCCVALTKVLSKYEYRSRVSQHLCFEIMGSIPAASAGSKGFLFSPS